MSNYPKEIDNFVEKLNKLENNTYVIEEEIITSNGIYEAELQHDNVNIKTINVYTGTKLSGNKIETYITSTPSLTPWKTNIKIFSSISPLYISYETQGDTVEAEDINKVQDSIVSTQKALNDEAARAVSRENQIESNLNSEISRAKSSEQTLTNNLAAEINRAKTSENTIADNLNSETARASNAEKVLTDNLTSEVSRAKSSENTLTINLNSEISRAKSAESSLANDLTNEINRAASVENTLNNNLTTETNRAKAAEGTLTTNLNSEITRATNAESTLTNTLNSEITRAKASENAITNTINTNKPIWDDKYTKNEVDNKISQVIANMDWKESVATFNDIAATYPTPDDGWTVNVKDTDITYRYSGNSWIAISANSIPLATSTVDGKMSKQDKIDHDDMNSKKHTHGNKSIIDTITQALIDTWNSAYTHISDSVKHITSAERALWNTVSNKLDRAGGTMSGRLVVTPGSDGGIAFPNDSFGGGGDTANITLQNPNGGEATEMTFTITNDANDIFHFHTSSNSGMKLNNNVIWNSGNDGAGSGLDADLLDGKHASDFAPSGFGLGEYMQSRAISDANAAITTGFYYCNGSSNCPSGAGDGNLMVLSHSNLWIQQIFFEYNGADNGRIFMRKMNNGVWKPWYQVARISDLPTKTSQLANDSNFITTQQLSNAGYGDMLKSVYDKNGDGIVDNANRATITHRLYRHENENEDLYYISPYWTGNANGWRIGAYNTSNDEQANIHKVSVDKADYADSAGKITANSNKSANDLPSTWPVGMYYTAVYNNGYPCSYGSLLTIKGTSGESIVQLCLEWSGTDGGRGGAWIRNKRDCGSDVWSPWSRLWSDKSKPLTWNDLKGV